MNTLIVLREIGIAICKLLIAGFLIYYEVTLELPISLIIILSVFVLKLIADVALWLIDIINITIYLNKLTDEELENLLENNENSNYFELKKLFKSNVLLDNDETKTEYKVKGYYLNYDDASDEIKTSLYLSDNKLHSMDRVLLIKGDK